MKKFLITLAIIIAILLIGGFFLFFNVQKVFDYFGSFESTIVSVNTEIGEEQVEFKFDMLLLSNVPFKIFVEKINYKVYFDTTQFSEGTKTFNSEFGEGEGDTLTLPLKLDVEKLRSKMKSFDPKDSTNLNIDLAVFIDFPIVGIEKIDVEIDKRIPAPQPPEVKVTAVNIDNFSFKNMDLSVDVDLYNKNPVSIIIEDANVTITFPDLFTGHVIFEDSIHIKPKDHTKINLKVYTEDLELVRDALEIVFEKRERSYELTGDMKIILPKRPQDIIKLNLHSSGETYLLKGRRENAEE